VSHVALAATEDLFFTRAPASIAAASSTSSAMQGADDGDLFLEYS
jgi:hypothetical protein